ncbi:zinc ABC transporter substrate-binding protein [Limibacillus halophilus]
MPSRFRRALSATLAISALVLVAGAAKAEPPKVVASILPLQSLAAQVMEGVGAPALLLDGGSSPHSYQLRPSEAQALQEADLVLWVGPPLESFLTGALESLSSPERQLELIELPGIELHDSGDHGEEAEEHGDEHQQHQHGDHAHAEGVDAHIWLSPGNAAVMLRGIAARLQAIDPENATRYQSNLEDALAGVGGLDRELRATLAPVAGKPFIVFHDGYGYFIERYGLEQAGAVTLSPDRAPGAGKLAELRALVEERGVACLFAEPQFSPAVLESLSRDSGARLAVLDPLGVSLEPGAAAYPALLRGLAQSLSDCLSRQ